MSFPKPSEDKKNSKIPIGSAVASAAIAKMSSSASLSTVARHRMNTLKMAKIPKTMVTMGVICVMSRTGATHIVWVLL